MVKAYHTVLGGSEAVGEILSIGEIRPASLRMDPMIAQNLCSDLMTTVTWEKSKAIPKAVEAFLEAIDIRLREIHPLPPYTRKTEFQCDDLLAGDLHSVFLSLGSWLPSGDAPRDMNGFSFDAEYLIDDGAALRRGDLIEEYEHFISDFLWNPKGKKTANRLMAGLENLRDKYELTGDKALAALWDRNFEAGYSELVYPGTIMTWQALEVYQDGEIVQRVA